MAPEVRGVRHGRAAVALVACLALLLAALTAPGVVLAAPPTNSPSPAMLLSAEGSFADLESSLAQSGGRVLHAFEPTAMIAQATDTTIASLTSQGLVSDVFRDEVQPEALASLSPDARFAAEAWNAYLAGANIGATSATERGLDGDALAPADSGGLTGQALDPSLYQQSEYLIGKVAVNVVLLESDGGIDPSTEDWTVAERQQVFQQVVAAMSWWQGMEPRAHLQFVYGDYYTAPIPTSYEPIGRPHTDERLWIGEAMSRLGYTSSSYITAVRMLNSASRLRYGTDWAFTIFVTDSSADADRHFADGYFAYAYIHGPFLVMTYGNNGYGPENMAAVAAHEMGHVFGALDEYASADISSGTLGGYLGVPNGNSGAGSSAQDCLMRGGIEPYAMHHLCDFSAGQVGWRDTDGDGILDPEDIFVAVNASIAAEGDGLTLSATATDMPWDSPTRNDYSINRLVAASYRVNEGPWYPMGPVDDSFDSGSEALTATLPAAARGLWQVDVRVRDSAGNEGIAFVPLSAAEGEVPATTSLTASAVSEGENGSIVIAGTALALGPSASLTMVEYRLNGGDWLPAAALDGAFDSPAEDFSVSLAYLASGLHRVEARAWTTSCWTLPEMWSQNVQVSNSLVASGGLTVYMPSVVDRS